MNRNDDLSRLSAEDRDDWREEILREDNTARLAVFDKLNQEAEDADAEVPPMPEELQDRLLEKYGEISAPKPASAPAQPGLLERIVEFFRVKPVAFGGGALAAAACALLLLFAMQPEDPGRTDRLRGGGGGMTQSVASGTAIYVIGADSADALLAELNAPKKVTVVGSASELPDTGRVVAVDLERSRLVVILDGKTENERPIGNEPREIALELRETLEAIQEQSTE